MNIKIELLKGHLYEMVDGMANDLEIEADRIADTTAICALSEIQSVLKSDIDSDFDVVESIVCIFEKYHLDFGGQHDF